MAEELLQEFIEQTRELKTPEAFSEEHPYPFLVRETTTKSNTPIRRDRTTTRLRGAAKPIGDAFGSGNVTIMRVFPRNPDDSDGAVTLGRDEGCDLLIDDGSISGLHSKFTFDFDEDEEMIFFLADAGSSNGTYLNGEKLENQDPVPVTDMDSVRFGPAVKFQFFTSSGFYQFLDFFRRIKKPT